MTTFEIIIITLNVIVLLCIGLIYDNTMKNFKVLSKDLVNILNNIKEDIRNNKKVIYYTDEKITNHNDEFKAFVKLLGEYNNSQKEILVDTKHYIANINKRLDDINEKLINEGLDNKATANDIANLKEDFHNEVSNIGVKLQETKTVLDDYIAKFDKCEFYRDFDSTDIINKLNKLESSITAFNLDCTKVKSPNSTTTKKSNKAKTNVKE